MKNLLLPLILLLGFLLRLYNNTAIALWHDEAFSALYIKYSWAEMMHRIILDVHPPLYYWVLRIWSYLFSDSLLSLRMLSIIFGVLTIYAGYLFVKAAFRSEKLGLLAATLIAINPFQIQYALEARMYTLGTFLVLISSYLLIKALQNNERKYWVWYAIVTAAGLYTHYYVPFTIAAQGLFVIYYLIKTQGLTLNLIKSKLTLNAIGSYILSIILFLPWVPSFLEQMKRVEQAYWIPAMDRWSIPGTIWKMMFGGQGINRLTLIVATVVGIILVGYYLKKVKEPEKWLVLFGLIVPFVASVLLSIKTALYLDRYFVFASLFFSILIGLTFGQIEKFVVRKTMVALLIIVSLVAFAKNWNGLDVKAFGQVNKKPGMAAAASFINDRASKNDKIFVGSSFVYFTFKHYNQTGIKPLLYSTGTLETIPHFSGTAILTNEDLILDFKQARKNENIWLIWTTGFGGSKPNVPGNWSKVDERSFADTPGFKGEILVTQYHVN